MKLLATLFQSVSAIIVLLILPPVPNYHCHLLSATLQMQLNKYIKSLHDKRIFQIYFFFYENILYMQMKKLDLFQVRS